MRIAILAWAMTTFATAQSAGWLEAARAGRVKEVQTALDRGAAVDEHDQNARTALMLAAANGHDKVVKLLLAHGADPRQRDSHGWNAYMFALLSSSGDIIRAHEAVLKLLPSPERLRIAVNVMWEPPEGSFQSCFLKPERLMQEMRALRPDGIVLEAFQRYAFAAGRDLVAIVQSDALGTSEVPNKIAPENIDATLLLAVQPAIRCGYQSDSLALSIQASLLFEGKEPRVLPRQETRPGMAANPRQYSIALAQDLKSGVAAVYATVVAALMERR